MPMPTLDPDIYKAAWLSDPAHKLPLPDKGNRLFFVEGEKVDRYDPFYSALIADGSLVLAEPAWVAETAKAAAEKAAADVAKAAADAEAATKVAEPAATPAATPAAAS